MAARNPYHAEHPLTDFLRTLDKHTLTTAPEAGRRKYVRTIKLVGWWNSIVVVGRDTTTQAARLLEYAYRDKQQFRFSNPTGDKTLGRHSSKAKSSILIFSILLELGHGDLIHYFQHRNRTDENLPIDRRELKDYFDEITHDNRTNDNETLAERFFEKQWKYCAVKFDGADFRSLERHAIIPIHRKELITGKGGTSTLWQIEVLSDFVGNELKAVASNSEYTPDEDPEGLGSVRSS